MRLSFSLPLDDFQRQLTRRLLKEEGAPFDPSDTEVFRERVRGLWERYQEALSGAAVGARLWPWHRADRLLFTRSHEEHIDDPDLPEKERLQLIRGLDRLNRWAGTYTWICSALKELIKNIPEEEVSVLDVGSGHGSFPIRLAKKGILGGRRLRVVGSDISVSYVEHAREAALREGAQVEFRVLDALKLDTLPERFDVITCTQTLHHFSPDFVAEFLFQARKSARRGVLVFDARRAPLTLAGTSAATFLLTGNPMLVHDGAVSVRRMYAPAELEMLAHVSPGGEVFSARNFGLVYVVLKARTG